jgi:NAD(P)-dependent dehydrogenase (short-subunit alcohol dehydrogenase family)
MGVQGQVALVTGGGRGLGRAMAVALAAAGAAVGACARWQDELAETASRAVAEGGVPALGSGKAFDECDDRRPRQDLGAKAVPLSRIALLRL